MRKFKITIPILLLVVLTLPANAFASTLSEDIFPKNVKGLPLAETEEQKPEGEIAEAYWAFYGTDDSETEILVFFSRIEGEEYLRTAVEDFIAGFEYETVQTFDGVEREDPYEVYVKDYKATLVTYRFYYLGVYFDAGLALVVVDDYFIAVEMLSYTGEPPSFSDLKDVLGLFIDQVPGEKPICGNTYCEQGETCSNCPQDCNACQELLPDLEVSFSEKNIKLELGGSTTLKLNIKNIGQGRAEDVYYKVHVDKPEVVDVYPLQGTVGNIDPGEEFYDYIGIAVKGSGTAYLAIHIRGDNIGSMMKFIQVSVPEAAALDVPESLFLLPGESQGISVFLTNAGEEPILVEVLSLKSLDPSVVSIEEGSEMTVSGQKGGIRQDQVISTESIDITNAIYPKPRIKANSIGDTELVFKLLYYFPEISMHEGKTLEKRVKVGVGESVGGEKPGLELKLKPSGLAVERDEARKVEVILNNTGSEVIKQGKILLSVSREAPFNATREITFGFIRPGREAKAEIEIIGHAQFPSGLQGDDLVVTGTLTFKGQFTTLDDREFTFEEEMKVSLVGEREKCDVANAGCMETVDCFVSLSNEMGCALEFADVVPYFDKPVAVVLATSDVCEIKDRVEAGDPIGAAVSSLLMTVDLGDNALDAVPGAGNILGVLTDIVEGSADCVEGFIYDAVNDYCAGGRGGYTGCANRLFGLIAEESDRWKESRSATHSVVAIGGSPIRLSVIDDNGQELGLSDGVLVIEKEDLKLVFIKNPEELDNGYNFQINGIGEGTYDLDIGLISDGEVVETVELRDQEINLDEEVSIPLAVKAEDGELTDLFVGDEAIEFKEEQERKPLILYIIIGIGAVLVVIIAVVVVIVLIKKRKKT